MLLVVAVEYFIIAILSLMDIVIFALAIKLKTFTELCKMPQLRALLISEIIAAFVHVFICIEWICFNLGITANVVSNTAHLHLISASGALVKIFYDSSTVVIFLQRIYFLCRPVLNARTSNKALLVLNCVLSLSVGLMYVVSPSTACHTVFLGSLVNYIILSFSVTIILSGTVMVILIKRFWTSVSSHTERTINKFVSSFFYLRILCEFIPFIIGALMRATIGRSLGTYVGAFGALGVALDTFVQSVVFSYMLRKSKQNVNQTHSTF
ncbi:hypothetical protein L596_019855 [Steinernema carpocapsae]|uniref:G-protein coupled receptors family 1 profile domain-containing protein n=1 Tax=Steinernema carpocapsae TaxID=34508 RepID=A0A4U5MS14_STECR|nr:hypothetical protein L596_019855 [Steinernema carpocapsae]